MEPNQDKNELVNDKKEAEQLFYSTTFIALLSSVFSLFLFLSAMGSALGNRGSSDSIFLFFVIINFLLLLLSIFLIKNFFDKYKDIALVLLNLLLIIPSLFFNIFMIIVIIIDIKSSLGV